MDDGDDIGAAIRAAAIQVRAPAGLRERVDRQQGDARRRGRRRTGLMGAAATVLAATVVALVLTLPGGGPTVVQAADAALARPAAPAPGPGAGSGRLDARVGPIWFPDWSGSGWRAVGRRDTRIGGRLVRTVYYADAQDRRVGYAIVAGAPLDVPAGRRHQVGDVTFTVLRRDGATVATWRERGHTCVLAARGVKPAGLVALAADRTY